jgi:uncharacterized protein
VSQENVDIVREVTERYNAGDVAWELIDPDIEWVVDPPAWVAGTYRGHDGVRTLQSRLAEAFDRVEVEFDEYLNAGDMVVTLGRMKVRGALSGVPTGQPLAQLVSVRNGCVVSIRGNLSPEEAVEAAGLPEQQP